MRINEISEGFKIMINPSRISLALVNDSISQKKNTRLVVYFLTLFFIIQTILSIIYLRNINVTIKSFIIIQPVILSLMNLFYLMLIDFVFLKLYKWKLIEFKKKYLIVKIVILSSFPFLFVFHNYVNGFINVAVILLMLDKIVIMVFVFKSLLIHKRVISFLYIIHMFFYYFLIRHFIFYLLIKANSYLMIPLITGFN